MGRAMMKHSEHTYTLDEHTNENFTLKWNICRKNTGGRQHTRSCDVVVGRLVGLGISVDIFLDWRLRFFGFAGRC